MTTCHALEVLFVKYAHMGAVLVHYHQSRLYGRHDVASLVLVMNRRHLCDYVIGTFGSREQCVGRCCGGQCRRVGKTIDKTLHTIIKTIRDIIKTIRGIIKALRLTIPKTL